MIKSGIVGITGFAGLELIKILVRHKEVSVDFIGSRSKVGLDLADVYPQFKNIVDKKIEPIDIDRLSKLDVVFLALPHTVSYEIVKRLYRKVKIIDMSADFRLRDVGTYESWYKVTHTAKELVGKATYGLCEINRQQIKNADLVANPGCYATSVILALTPIANFVKDVVVDAKSGVSGAGRGLKEGLQFCEVNENFKAYAVSGHRHVPEMEQELRRFNNNIRVTFVPHLLPIQRGILSTVYVSVDEELDYKRVFEEFYKDSFFVRICDVPPTINSVRGTNFCDIYSYFDKRTKKLIIISVIDNLIKGASGQAVQNMNIVFNLDEKEGLLNQPYYP